MWDTARRTLARIAELGEREGVTFVLENLNTAVDHPRTPFARAADTLDLVRGVDSPHLRLNLDLYHAQIGEGNLIELCREALPWVAEVQVADVPGPVRAGHRRDPLRRRSPGRWRMPGSPVSSAWRPSRSADPDAALAAFREAFTPDLPGGRATQPAHPASVSG